MDEQRYPTVLIIGLGRVGHACLQLMASQGFTHFVLMDHDQVKQKNIPDTRYRPEDVGKRKVQAAAELALRANPQAQIKTLGYPAERVDFVWLFERAGLGTGWSVALFAFDDPAALLKANEALYPRLPIVFPGLHARAQSGHVIYSIPRLTSCLACAMGQGTREVRRPLRQLRPDEARFGLEACEPLAQCALQIVAEIAGLRPQQYVHPLTRRTILFLDNNLTRGTWWPARRQARCQICSEGR